MNTGDWLKTIIVGVIGYKVINRVTDNGLKTTIKTGVSKLNQLVNDKKVLHGGLGAAAGVYAGSKVQKSDVARDVGVGAGTGGLIGYLYNKNRDKLNDQVNKYFGSHKTKSTPETTQ